jgi:hypothetical protein
MAPQPLQQTPSNPFGGSGPDPSQNLAAKAPDAHKSAFTQMFGPGDHPATPASMPPPIPGPAGGGFGGGGGFSGGGGAGANMGATQAFSARSPASGPPANPQFAPGPSDYTQMIKVSSVPLLAKPPAPPQSRPAPPPKESNPYMILAIVFGVLFLIALIVILWFALSKH